MSSAAKPEKVGFRTGIDRVLAHARELGGVVVESAAGWMVSIPRPNAAPDEVLVEAEAARAAGVSVRTLRDARRRGELRMFGRQRSRTVRRTDLDAWLELRRAPVAGADDDAMDRRVARLERSKKVAAR